jgi:hypothetical protein
MTQAKRVHSTPRRTASKIKPKRSAVSRVLKSGFELVPVRKRSGKPAPIRAFAKVDWRPWRRTADMRPTELIPSGEQMDVTGVSCRIAYGLMLMERDKLIAMHGTTDHGHVDQMMAGLFETAEWLKATAHMVEAAYLRVLASAAAAYAQGVKFKGVDDKPARRKVAQS